MEILKEDSYHSRYNPLREAKIFVDASLQGKHPSLVFIIGSGKNYIGSYIRSILPHTHIVILEPCNIFKTILKNSYDFAYCTSSDTNLINFLNTTISKSSIEGGVAILEWKAITNAFVIQSNEIKEKLKIVLESVSSNAATSAYWSKRWLKNTIKFFENITKPAILEEGNKNIILTCAGPSLLDDIENIKKYRHQLNIVSLCSSLSTLIENDIIPDLVISTDPGFWNSYHYRALLNYNIPLAVSPSSFIPQQILEQNIIVPLNTNLIFEQIFFEESNLDCVNVSSSGSVTGTAIDLCSALTSKNVYISGFDLAAKYNFDHAKAYAFNTFDLEKECRLDGVLSMQSHRIFEKYQFSFGAFRSSRAFSVYAENIRVGQNSKGRTFRLGSSPVKTTICNSSFPSDNNYNGKDIAIIEKKQKSKLDTISILRLLERTIIFFEDESKKNIAIKSPLSFNAITLFRAISPEKAPELISLCSRGEADFDDLEKVKIEAEFNALKLVEK